MLELILFILGLNIGFLLGGMRVYYRTGLKNDGILMGKDAELFEQKMQENTEKYL